MKVIKITFLSNKAFFTSCNFVILLLSPNPWTRNFDSLAYEKVDLWENNTSINLIYFQNNKSKKLNVHLLRFVVSTIVYLSLSANNLKIGHCARIGDIKIKV